MSYIPKYTSITIVRQIEKLLQEISDEDVTKGIEYGERYTEDFVVACGYDLESLPSEVKTAMEELSTYRAIEDLIERVPYDPEFKQAVADRMRGLAERKEVSIKMRVKKTWHGIAVSVIHRKIKEKYYED